MFNQPLSESRDGLLNIVDAEVSTVEEFLRYVYTGELNEMEKNASGLYVIADKYDIQDLKMMCENFIMRSISIPNIFSIYDLGKLLNSEGILRKCTKKFTE